MIDSVVYIRYTHIYKTMPSDDNMQGESVVEERPLVFPSPSTLLPPLYKTIANLVNIH